MKPVRPPVRTALALRTGIRPGNVYSDACYAKRNWNNIWKSYEAILFGSDLYPEEDLWKCLAVSGEKDWWKDFQKDLNQEKACKYTINTEEGKKRYWANNEERNAWSKWKQDMIDTMGCRSYE